jgi:hypothetical protein
MYFSNNDDALRARLRAKKIHRLLELERMPSQPDGDLGGTLKAVIQNLSDHAPTLLEAFAQSGCQEKGQYELAQFLALLEVTLEELPVHRR